MVKPVQLHYDTARELLESMADSISGVTIDGKDRTCAEYLAESKLVLEYLAYFLKEPTVWVNTIPEDRRSKLTDDQIMIAGLVEFLDSAPWLARLGTYEECWNAVEFLIATKLITFELSHTVFSETSRKDEALPVPIFKLQRDSAALPVDTGQVLATYVNSQTEVRRRRENLLVDLGAAAPQVGSSNTARVLDLSRYAEPIVVRQVVYSGRTVNPVKMADGTETKIDYRTEVARRQGGMTVKLMILSPAAQPPMDEGTRPGDSSKPGERLVANLAEGLLKLREDNDGKPLDPRIEVRLYGDKPEKSLFRGIMVESQGKIVHTQFCVWDFEEQRGTHGEYGQTDGESNLALILRKYFDDAFKESVPLYPEQFKKWVWENISKGAWASLVGFVVAWTIAAVKYMVLKQTTDPTAFITLLGAAVIGLFEWWPQRERLKTLRWWSPEEKKAAYDMEYLRVKRDEAKKERETLDAMKDKLGAGNLKVSTVRTDNYQPLSPGQFAVHVDEEKRKLAAP